MKGEINNSKLGLALGTFFALLHIVWALLIAVIPGPFQNFLNWIFALHFLEPLFILTNFGIINAIMLIALTFIVGYILGWLFAAIWNWAIKSKT